MRIVGVLAGLTVALCAGAAQARTCAADDVRQSFHRGSESGRSGVLDSIRANAVSTTASTDLACDLAKLRSRYGARAGRQQAFMNRGAGVTGVAGIVAAYADGAGAATQTYWAAGALLPVLLASWNAYEPTRDLYNGAGLSLDYMTTRMAEIRRTDSLLIALATGQTTIPAVRPTDLTTGISGTATDCAALDGEMKTIESGSDASLKTEARKLLMTCAAFAVARSELQIFMVEAIELQTFLDRMEAFDALKLDALITHIDQDLAYSPLETFGALAAAPFEAAGTLLSGSNGREALEALRTQAAFRDFKVDLSRIDLPPAPSMVEPVTLSAAGAGNTKVRAAANAINTARPALARATYLAGRLRRLAVLDRVGLSYDATTRTLALTSSSWTQTIPPATVTSADGKPG